MFETMTTGEKALIGATAIGIAALVFHKPTRNAVGLSDGRRRKRNKDQRLNYATKQAIKEEEQGEGYFKYAKVKPKVTTRYSKGKWGDNRSRAKIIEVDGMDWVMVTPKRKYRRTKKQIF